MTTKWLTFDPDDQDGDTDDRTGFLSTYPEVHAVGWGLAYGLLLALSLAFPEPVFMAAAAATLRAVYYAHTGREIEVRGRRIELPARYLRQIRREPHYFDGSIFVGLTVGVGLLSHAPVAVPF